MKQTTNIQKLIYTGMLAAVAGVLMSLEFSVPLMPPFYKIDFSDVPSIVALFTLGPVSAVWVEIIKILIKLITVGTNSMYVGELGNLIGVFVFVGPIWLIYKKMGMTKKAEKVSLISAIPIRTFFACCLNAFVTLPLYAAAMGLSLNEVIVSVAAVNPAISNLPTFIILATIPFNIIKLGLNSLIAYIIYQRIKSTNVIAFTRKGKKA